LPKWGQRSEGEEEKIAKIKMGMHRQDRSDGGKTGGSTQGQFFLGVQKALRK
jgi:hypothetical protein